VVPEALKPRKIAINTVANSKTINAQPELAQAA
jgi:hypothetical protein